VFATPNVMEIKTVNLPISYSGDYSILTSSFSTEETTASNAWQEIINYNSIGLSSFKFGVGAWSGFFWMTIG